MGVTNVLQRTVKGGRIVCDIAREWLKKAKGFSDDYDRFISAFIALNFLYGGRSGVSGRDKMVECLEEICEIHHIDPFETDPYEYYKQPIIDMRPDKHRKVPITIKGNPHSLFESIYQVRCNLFHGNKSLNDERDKRLVAQGAEVIIGILNQHFGIAKDALGDG